MKRIITYSLLFSLLFYQCATTPKVTYNIPDNTSDFRRKVLIARLDKGKELFKQNCSECHGLFKKGKDNIPNFTNAQIDNYSARFMRRDPKNHAVMAKMSTEQLDETLSFLKYKRPQDPDSAATTKRKN